jgi:MFS superfamily sulfate permease-like transporter
VAPVGGALLLDGAGRSINEVLAGVTLVALSLPLNIGYASIIGLPATTGVYASIVPVLVFALTTGSRRLVVGPDATITALLAAAIIPVVAMGVEPTIAALGAALLTGLLLLTAWLLQLGGLVRFLSHAVLVGFIAGLGIEVLTSQVRRIMAVEVDAEGWVREVIALVAAVPEASSASIVVGLSTIAVVRVLRRVGPRAPGSLIALVVVGGAVAWLEPDGVEVLGPVPAGLPVPTFPLMPLEAWLALLPVSLAIAALTIAEGVLLSQKEGRANGEEIVPNQEVFAYGLSNLAGALFSAMPIGASASRTAALATTGARTQVPAIVGAAVAGVVALAFTGLIAAIPMAALGGLVANAVIRIIDVQTFRHLARVRRGDLAIALGCAAGVLLLGPLPGLAVAAIASSVDVVRRAAAMPWSTLSVPPADADGRFSAGDAAYLHVGLRILRPEGPLFFANADDVRTALSAAVSAPESRWVIIDLEAVSDIDPTAASALAEGIATAASQEVLIAFSRVRQPIERLLDTYGLLETIGQDRIFATNRAAVAAFRRED